MIRGQVPLHISPSTSAQSISSLLRLTGGSHFIFGPEHQELAKASSSPNVDLFEWCSITKAQPVDDDPRWRTELSYEEEANETVSIIHSSGSTGDPKPIPWNHRTWLASTWFAPPGDNFIMTPLCHGYARMGAWSALANATRLFIFPTTSAPIGENLCKALDHTKPLGCPCAPQGDKRLCRRGRSAPANRARHHLRESPSHRSRQCTREARSAADQPRRGERSRIHPRQYRGRWRLGSCAAPELV